VKYVGVLRAMKDDKATQNQAKSLYCAANKLRGAFAQCSSTVKSTLFRASHAYIGMQ